MQGGSPMATVLVVDTDSNFCMNLAQALLANSIDCERATNSGDATLLLYGGGVDIVLIDPSPLNLDSGNTRLLLDLVSDSNIPVIFCKTGSYEIRLPRTLNLEGIYYKPIDIEKIISRIKKLIRVRQPA